MHSTNLMGDLSMQLRERWLGLLAGSPLPAHLFYPAPLPRERRAARTGRLSIEIVSHCWRYSRLLAYQLTSLVDHAVHEADVTMTVFHAAEDEQTVRLLDFFADRTLANITWRPRVLTPPMLFRRAIGRNLAAMKSDADWLWFTDCDMTFQAGCLDSLHAALQGRSDALVHPRVESKTEAYAVPGQAFDNALGTPQLLRLDPSEFVPGVVTRATGPLQIVHGDVARAVGYCNAIPYYQQPVPRFAKCTEDRVFRWLLGTSGTPVDVAGVCRVQHVEKGRYDASDAGFRQQVRSWQDRRRRSSRATR